MLNAPQHGAMKHSLVMEDLGSFASDVKIKFFEWLGINPELTLDMVFGIDKGNRQLYTSFIRQKSIQENRKNNEQDSGNGSDISKRAIACRADYDLGDIGCSTRRNRLSPVSRRSHRAERRQMWRDPS
ncbi:hypothetical protein BWQ96_05764 [Gracilariopsis chorda]|uniref:Uncharacterized protein n=1 Tax=Gracilariopsis chorda TaxID=448386 RepID=A0A2V3IQU9_9FLOR|nr:hypothetical protein BWQ96_05764 [Gracilariopsis chorda]|eukprot:PXF44492.1 hypothetical protein BWQ96_05764 [Gracilariopsis chorda]